jgi:hypothetical protein
MVGVRDRVQPGGGEDLPPAGRPAPAIHLRLRALLGRGLPGQREAGAQVVAVQRLAVGQPAGVLLEHLRPDGVAVGPWDGQQVQRAGWRLDVHQLRPALHEPAQAVVAAGGDRLVDVLPEGGRGQADPHPGQVRRGVRVVRDPARPASAGRAGRDRPAAAAAG